MGANHLSISREKRVGIIDRSTAPSKKGMEGEAGEEGGGGGVSISRRKKPRIIEVFVYEFLAWSHLI